MMSWWHCLGQRQALIAYHINVEYMECDCAPSYGVVDMHRGFITLLSVQVGAKFWSNWRKALPKWKICIGASLHCYLCRWGPNFSQIGGRHCPNEIVVQWLRLYTTIHCASHLILYVWSGLGTFICCGWAYGCTLTLLYLCNLQVHAKSWKIGLLVGENWG